VATVVNRVIARPAERCYAMFCNARLLTAWVPGLKRAKVVLADAEGRPAEVLFAYGESRSYSLVYRYQPDQLRIDWSQGIGRRDGVSGWALFRPLGKGCELTYTLEIGEGRSAEDIALGDPKGIVESFAKFMESGPP
jgi:uncharacterized protein YndB with AHSA1/START domain